MAENQNIIRLRRGENLGDLFRIQRLYHSAFPRTERKPFGIILRMAKQGKTDLWCLERSGEFLGLAATVNGNDRVLLDYLAVRENCRGQGIGSAAMELLMAEYGDKGLFVEIESTRSGGAEQEKRKRFYLAAGMTDLGVSARVFGVDMDLLGIRCRLDFADYQNFYREHYSPWAAEHIEPMDPGHTENREG